MLALTYRALQLENHNLTKRYWHEWKRTQTEEGMIVPKRHKLEANGNGPEQYRNNTPRKDIQSSTQVSQKRQLCRARLERRISKHRRTIFWRRWNNQLESKVGMTQAAAYTYLDCKQSMHALYIRT